jgi:hypothetical protein
MKFIRRFCTTKGQPYEDISFVERVSELKNADGSTASSAIKIQVPEEYYEYARKFLYYQLYRASLPFDEYLSEHSTPGYVQIKNLSWKDFLPGKSSVLDCVVSGIKDGSSFVLEDDLS